MRHFNCLGLAAFALILHVAGIGANAQSISIQLENGAFKVAGWKAPLSPPGRDWAAVFSVYTGAANGPALLGSYAVESGALVFHPKYPFAPGVRYRAVFRRPRGATLAKIFDGPPRATVPQARVENIYPTADVLPANLLRIYIRFSAPMSRGEAAARIHMLDAKGTPLPGVFLPGEELWDPAGMRLTMTLDPGRIKRGLTSNETMGPPVADGKQYTLAVDREWTDARGVPMVEGFRKIFRGSPAQRTPPDPATWRIAAPNPGTMEALSLTFPAPMNYALLQHMLWVETQNVNVAGTADTAQHETQWRFTPKTPWKTGEYRLIVDTAIEDLAGNRVGRPFDIDVFEHVTQHILTKTISLPFRIH